MSAAGLSRHFDGLPMTSDLPPEAEIVAGRRLSWRRRHEIEVEAMTCST
jgi:hypothetical protein